MTKLSEHLNETLAELEAAGEDKPVAVLMTLQQLHLLLLVCRGTRQLWTAGKAMQEAVSALDAAVEPLEKAHEQVRKGLKE